MVRYEKGHLNILKVIVSIFVVLFVLLGALCFAYSKSMKIDIGEKNIELELNSEYNVSDIKAETLFDKNPNVEIIGELDTSKVGTYQINYVLKSFLFIITDAKIIRVIDNTPPTIELKGESDIKIYQDGKYNEQGATATDNYDGDITDKIVIDSSKLDMSKLGDYEILYSVKDSSDNSAEAKRIIHVVAREVQGASNRNYISGAGNIYLTFDDGPSTYTPTFLDLLKKYDAKATFFVTGRGSDSSIKRAYEEGHTIGLHTWSHSYSIYASVDTYFNDLNKIDERVYNLIGEHSKIIRFPGGASNTVSRNYCRGIMSTLSKEVQSRGYEYWDWNISSGDAGATTDPNQVYENVISGISKNKTNVVLMHDIHSYTMNALEPILKWGIENGYTFKSLSLDLKPVHHGIAN